MSMSGCQVLSPQVHVHLPNSFQGCSGTATGAFHDVPFSVCFMYSVMNIGSRSRVQNRFADGSNHHSSDLVDLDQTDRSRSRV